MPRDSSTTFRLLVLASVTLLSLVMIARSQFAHDQFQLMLLGWSYHAEQTLPAHGITMSGGGLYPGSFTALLFGLPLSVWEDERAVTALILLTHLAAFLLLDRVVARTFDARTRLWFAVLFWANPWRVYYSTHLWNPNFLVFLGALHLVTIWWQRERPDFLWSFLHIFALGAAFQLHGSFLILVFVTALLLWRSYFRLHLVGALTGGVIVLATLLPWIDAILQDPSIAPGAQSYPGAGGVVYPMLRGVLYWLLYPSLYFNAHMTSYDFAAGIGPAWGFASRPLEVLSYVAGAVTAVVSLVVTWGWWRRRPRPWRREERAPEFLSDAEWLDGACRLTFLAVLLACALSPTTPMSWQLLAVFHMAILPMTLWLSRDDAKARIHRRVLSVGFAVALVCLAAGAPMFRKGGRDAYALAIRQPSTMLERLGVTERATVVIDEEIGLPEDVRAIGRIRDRGELVEPQLPSDP